MTPGLVVVLVVKVLGVVGGGVSLVGGNCLAIRQKNMLNIRIWLRQTEQVI
jgi:hypothetical protein